MRKYYIVFTAGLFLLLPLLGFGQEWTSMMEDPNRNFYEVKEAFDAWWKDKDETEKGKGFKPYKRWEWFTEQRVYPSGDLNLIYSGISEYFNQYLEDEVSGVRTLTGNWTHLGPINVPTNGGGAGRCNFLRFDPNNNSILWTGAPAGGLWKSTDAGLSWTNWNTDHLPVIGCSDLAIDPTNTNIMYLATGDGDGGDTYSIGVLKSTDGGQTWQPSGLNWQVTQTRRIRRLVMHPTNNQILIAATTDGLYRTTNGGSSWSQVQTGNFYDLEFKPNAPTIWYASSNRFFRSTDNGASWNQITNGVPASGEIRRFAIAVTPANSNYVYLLGASQSDNGFYALYRSTDSGLSFSYRSGTPNILGWNSNGSDSGGQGWYDLALAASPTDANAIVAGGVNIWRSTNGGTSWTINGHWTGSGAPYVHADIHDLIYVPGSGNTYYAACDGGVFRTTNNGGSWTDLSNGLEIAQMYKIGLSATNPNLMLSGWQDNGTNRLNGTAWRRVIGGDGMECIIDHSNANIMYGALYYGNIRKSTNGGTNFSTIVNSNADSGVNSKGLWVTPYVMHPSHAQTLLVGKSELYRSTNGGSDWTTLGAISGSGQIRAIAYAPSNPEVIYVARTNTIHRTANGGTSFSNISTGLPNQTITYIAVSTSNPNRAYVTYSGYSSGNKIFLTTNGGTSWSNYSQGLPNVPVNCIVYETGSNDGVYAGTDVGVYYRNAGMNAWIPFSGGLPNVVVDELEIQYTARKLRAGTYGRGLWESDLYTVPTAPVAVIGQTEDTICAGGSVVFQDQSANYPTSRLWTFAGGQPETSTAASQSVTFANPGIYPITLQVTNPAGSNTTTSYVIVKPNPDVIISADKTAVCKGETITLSADGADAYNWSGGLGSGQEVTFSPMSSMQVSVAGTTQGCTGNASLQITVNDLPAVSIIQGDTGVCPGGSIVLNALGAGQYLWSLDGSTDEEIIYTPDSAGTVSVTGWSAAGCENTAEIYVDIYPSPVVGFESSGHTLCEGGTAWLILTGAEKYFLFGNPITEDTLLFTLTENAVYTFTGISDKGCIATGQYAFTVFQNPEVTVTASDLAVCEGMEVTLMAEGALTYAWEGGAWTGENITLQLLNTGIYHVVGTDENGCSAAASVEIVVHPLPQVTVSSSNVEVCIGGEVMILASGNAVSYEWSDNLGLDPLLTYYPEKSGVITVAGQSAEGCTQTREITVIVNPLPVIGLTTSQTRVCIHEEVTLTAIGGETYYWEAFGLSGTSITVSIHEAGFISVVGQDMKGCKATADIYIDVAKPTMMFDNWSGQDCPTSIMSLIPEEGWYITNVHVEEIEALMFFNANLAMFDMSGVELPYAYVTLSDGSLTCTFDIVLSEVAEAAFLEYDACLRTMTVQGPCEKGQWWISIDRKDLLHKMAEGGKVLFGITQEEVDRHKYLFVCDGHCGQVHSHVIKVNTGPCREQYFDLIVIPNPMSVYGEIIVDHHAGGRMDLRVWNAIGQIVYNDQWLHGGGRDTYQLPLSLWASGSYFMEVQDGDGKKRTKNFVVTNSR